MELIALATGAAALGAFTYSRPTRLFALCVASWFHAGGIRSRRVRLPRARVRYWSGGRGEPVVFVHGFGTEAAVNWHAQLPAARRRFRVVAPDLPGFGASTRIGDANCIGVQVTCLRDLLDHLGIERASLVGHSMGGWISLAFAARHPDRVARLVLVDAAGLRFEPDRDLAGVLLPECVDDVLRLMAANFQRPPRLPRFVLRDIMRTCRREMIARTTLLERLLAGDEFVDTELGQVAAPTLVVWGESDPLTPIALGRRLAAELPSARLAVFDDCAHSPNVEQSRRFNALVLDFLENGHAAVAGSTRHAAVG